MLVAILFAALQASIVVAAIPSLASLPGPLPLRMNAEVGVVAVGSWQWLFAAVAVNVAIIVINALLLRIDQAPAMRAPIVALTVMTALFLLLGTMASLRVALYQPSS